MEEEFSLEEEYIKLAKKHNLPNLESISQDFDIEKIANKETSFLIREIRRVVNEKISAYIHLFETLLNPQGPPMFVFKIIKNMSPEEKQKIQKLYTFLSKTQIQIMKLDTVYSEEKEIAFIKETYEMWQKTKQEIFTLFESLETNFENYETEKSKTYFD